MAGENRAETGSSQTGALTMSGRGGTYRRPVPDDFAEHARETNTQLRARYRIGTYTITRWRKLIGVDVAHAVRAMPEDFRDIAPGLTKRGAERHWNASPEVVKRWYAEAGIQSAPQYRPKTDAPPKRMKSRGANFTSRAGRVDPTRDHDGREVSRAGMAARFLQRLGPIYRCDATGKPLPDGFFWNRGGYVLTDDEVIDRAERKGWDPDAWKRLPQRVAA